MATNEKVDVDVLVNLDVEKSTSLNDLKKNLKSLKSAALEVGEASPVFQKLTENANKLQDKLDDLKDSAVSLKGTGVEKLTNSFNLLKESFAGGDVDKAKIAFKGLGAAMSAIPIFLLIEGIKLLIENFDKVVQFVKDLGFFASESDKKIQKLNATLEETKKLNKTLIPELENRIKLLEAEGASSDKLLKAKNDLFNAQKKELELQVKINIEKAHEILMNYNLEEQYLIMSANVAKAAKQYVQAEILMKAADFSRKKRAEEFIQLSKEGIQTIKDINTEAQVEQIKVDKAETKAAKDKSAELKKIQDERNAQALADLEKFGKQLQDVIDKDAEIAKKEAKEAQDKQREEQLDSDDTFYANKHAKAIKAAQNDLIGDEQNYEKKRKLLDEQRQEEIRIAQQKGEDIAAINKKYAILDEKLFHEGVTKAANATSEAMRKIGGESSNLMASLNDSFLKLFIAIDSKAMSTVEKIQAGLQAVASILTAINDYQNKNAAERSAAIEKDLQKDIETIETSKNEELNVLTQNANMQLENENLTSEQRNKILADYNKNKEKIEKDAAQAEYNLKIKAYYKETALKKQAFEQDKAFRTATAIIQTISGALAAVTSALNSSIPYPGNIIAAVLSGAAVAAAGAIQVANIQKQQFDAGSPPSAPNISLNGVDNSGGVSQNGAQDGPSLKRIGRDNNADGEIDNAVKRQGNNEPVRAYVVAGDITAVQNKNALIERRSSF